MPDLHTIIEPATEDDYEAIAAIYNTYIAANNTTMEEKLYDHAAIKEWIDSFSEREKLLVIKKGAAVAGWGVIKKYSERQGYATACETSVYLAEKNLRQGYGTLLKSRLIAECRRLHYHHIVAKIWADNIASIEYNKKLGYTVVGIQKEIGKKNCQWVDVVIMQYIINEANK